MYHHRCPSFCLPLRCSSRWSWGVPNLARLHFFSALSEAPTSCSSALCQLSYISHMWSTSAPLRTSPGPTSVGLQACFLVGNTDNEANIRESYCCNDDVALEFNWCGVVFFYFPLFPAFNVLVNFGIAITYPTLISLGIVLSVPVNASECLSCCALL